ncbi:MAG: signal peptidase II [Candidatus Marinimicrobia bacterium]|nr:signal peptidase II [Candidatus Neomarinimicrobiota bacterium]
MSIYGLIVAIVALDQWSKWEVRTSFELYQSKPIIQDVFHFTYVTNEGMAFGLSFPGGKHILLVMTILLTGFIVGFLWKERNGHPFVKYGLALILSGAVGNLIDRLLYGKVVDFMDIMIGDLHWYIFNIADSSVTIGMALFIIHSFLIENSRSVGKITV